MISDFLPKIDSAKCIGCELCVRVCPNDALALINDTAVVSRPEACNYTGACQEICPTEAISLTYEIVFFDDSPPKNNFW
ncbi:MAG: 4Fe-4S binding protein [Chloroflexi bacterium]|nr:4Fe-4S binding protein [Chloroflexota bacterium]